MLKHSSKGVNCLPSIEGTPSPDNSMRIFSLKELQALTTEYYAPLFGLMDWELTIWLEGPSTLKDAIGEAETNSLVREGVITLLAPQYWSARPNKDTYDMEQVLAHELLHITLWAWGRLLNGLPEKQGLDNTLYEQTIDKLAWAHVNQRRVAADTARAYEELGRVLEQSRAQANLTPEEREDEEHMQQMRQLSGYSFTANNGE